MTSDTSHVLSPVSPSSAEASEGSGGPLNDRRGGRLHRWFAGSGDRAHPWLPWSLLGVAYVLLNALLVPTAAYSYDEAGLVGAANDWLRWGLPLVNASKVGVDVPVLGLLAEALAHAIRLTGLVSGVAAIHIAYKLPLLVANVFCAVSLARLAERFGVRRPAMVALLWLFNPVSFWVAAGHGQIEPLSVLAAVSSFDLLLSGYPAAAGMLCALGAGVEYFPLAVAAAAVFLVAHRRLSLGAFGHYLAGLVIGLVACFAPLLISSTLRAGTFAAFGGAVAPTHVAHGSPSSPWGFSVWFLPPRLEIPPAPVLAAIALLLAAGVLAQATFAVRRRALEPERAACGVVGLLLVLTVIVNPVTSPQFALIAGGGLFLLAVAFGLSLWAAAFIPFAGLFTYFLYESPWVFFYDLWGQRPMQLPQLPVSSLAAVLLARFFTLASLAALAWVTAVHLRRSHAMRRDPGQRERLGLVLGASLLGCSALACLGAVPAFWAAVAPGGPARPIDLTGVVSTPPQDVALTPNAVVVRYPRLLFRWASRATVEPRSVVDVVPTSLFLPPRGSISTATPTSQWPEIRLVLPDGGERSSLSVRLLVGSSSWTSPAAPSLSHVTFLANGTPVQATSVSWSTPTWAVVNLLISERLLGPSRALTLRAPPVVGKWDSWGPIYPSRRTNLAVDPVFVGTGFRRWEPIVNVMPGTGSFYATVDGRQRHLSFSVADTGSQTPVATISGLPAAASFSLPRSAVPFGIADVLTAEFQWPPAAPFHYPELLLIGGWAWAAALGALGALGALRFRRALRGDGPCGSRQRSARSFATASTTST